MKIVHADALVCVFNLIFEAIVELNYKLPSKSICKPDVDLDHPLDHSEIIFHTVFDAGFALVPQLVESRLDPVANLKGSSRMFWVVD